MAKSDFTGIGKDWQTGQPTTYPQLELSKWDNETSLWVSMGTLDGTAINSQQTAYKQGSKWTTNAGSIEIYPIKIGEDDGFEYEITLPKKPKTNVFDFQLSYFGYDFYYQPALAQDEIDSGSFRPENVVGSYAVYGPYSGNEYMAGKAFHIYRPMAYDDSNNSVWANMNIDNSIMTITIPQDFLDKAKYPVTIDPAVGNTIKGATHANNTAADAYFAKGLVSGKGGLVSKVVAWWNFTYDGSVSLKGLVFLNSTGALVDDGVSGATIRSSPNGAYWVPIAYSTKPTVESDTWYQIGYIGSNSKRFDYYYDTVTNAGGRDVNSYTTPTDIGLPPWDTNNIRVSVYANYTTVPDIVWGSPSSNNSVTNNASWIFWNASTWSYSPLECKITINGTNTTMTVSGSNCYYNATGLTNATTYCAWITANDTTGGSSNISSTMCATINLTSYSPPGNLDISWNAPAVNNSATVNASWIYWNVTISTIPLACILTINGTNYTMSNTTKYCYYNSTGLTNATTYCSWVTANDTSGGSSSRSTTMCQTINLTQTIPPSDLITVTFVSPTDNDNAVVYRDWSYVNASVSSIYNSTAFIDWNRSLVGWWRFNSESGENNTFFRDWSTWENNGTCANETVCPAYSDSGVFGKSMSYNGSKKYIDVGNQDSLRITGNMTVLAWVNFSASQSSSTIVSRWGATDHSYRLSIGSTPNNNKFSFVVIVSGVTKAAQSASTYNDGKWHQVIGIFDGSNVRLTVDDGLENIIGDATEGPVDSGIDGIIIGGMNYSITGNFAFNGLIDEVRIFNRVLSMEEINASYNAGLYRLQHNFTELAKGNYTFKAYAQDVLGNVNSTEYRAINLTSAGDTTPPTYSEIGVNNTNPTILDWVNFSSKWSDDVGLYNYIFSWNASGALCNTWANDSTVLFSGNPGYANTTKQIPATCLNTINNIAWRVYANDTSANWASFPDTLSFSTPPANCWQEDTVGHSLWIPTGCLYKVESSLDQLGY